ncbi:MAG: glycerophosphoryl diester phosphodiesterase membrane domain-containing protein [Bacteroidia bacterium]|nr:glycerophosphoryl diester phosphodiesterase membrane domain-containing protein [Bacteroidia bacterium]
MEEFSSHPLYRRHTIDSAMSSLWDFYRKKFLVLFISSFVMSLIMQYISSTIDFTGLTDMTDPVKMLEKVREFIWPMILVSIINLLFTTILQYYIIYNPVNPDVNIFVSSYKSLKYFILYLIIMVLFIFFGSFALVLGLFALIIGVFFVALYLMTIYLFILPVLMVEGPNIGNAISRSFGLTHKNFWANMGWVAVFILILIVISVVLSMVVMIPFTGSIFKGITNPEEALNTLNYMTNPWYLILGSLANALTFPLLPIFGAILYFNGNAKEQEIPLAVPEDNQPEKIKVEDLYAKPKEGDQ